MLNIIKILLFWLFILMKIISNFSLLLVFFLIKKHLQIFFLNNLIFLFFILELILIIKLIYLIIIKYFYSN